MKNDDIRDQGFEKVLKDKMNELSDSVDCFGKISARAFPEEDSVFTESGFTVNETENITGRSSAPKLLKWAALSAAAVLAVVFIPRTGIVQHLYSDLSGSLQKDFRNILTEIDRETAEHTYRQIDMPLSRYSANDILTTPFFACPFEDTGRSGANVRIYIRQTGAGQYGSYDTAQVFAVEYIGEYTADNIIAAAESAYTFSDEELEKVSVSNKGADTLKADTAYGFHTRDNSDMLLDSEEEEVSAASFSCGCWFKGKEGTEYLTADVLYWQKVSDGVSVCFYDMTDPFDDDELVFDENARRQMWKKSVYFNGNTAFPAESGMRYRRTDITKADASAENGGDIAYAYPFEPLTSDYRTLEAGGTIEVQRSDLKRTLSSITVPYDKELLRGLKVYFPAKERDSIPVEKEILYNGKMLRDKAETLRLEEQHRKNEEAEIIQKIEEEQRAFEAQERHNREASESAMQK